MNVEPKFIESGGKRKVVTFYLLAGSDLRRVSEWVVGSERDDGVRSRVWDALRDVLLSTALEELDPDEESIAAIYTRLNERIPPPPREPSDSSLTVPGFEGLPTWALKALEPRTPKRKRRRKKRLF